MYSGKKNSPSLLRFLTINLQECWATKCITRWPKWVHVLIWACLIIVVFAIQEIFLSEGYLISFYILPILYGVVFLSVRSDIIVILWTEVIVIFHNWGNFNTLAIAKVLSVPLVLGITSLVSRLLQRMLVRERNIRQERELLNQMAQESIVITDTSGRILSVNPAFTRSTGYESSESLGQDLWALLASGRHDAGFYTDIWQLIKERGQWQGEIWHRGKNGEIYPVWLCISSLKNPIGIVTNYVHVAQDITIDIRLRQHLGLKLIWPNQSSLTALPG